MGATSQDRTPAVSGELGRRAAMTPVSIDVLNPGGKRSTYRMEMVDDRFLSPFLLQMSVFSAIDATERMSGASSFLVDRKSTRLNSSHSQISYAVFCLKKKNKYIPIQHSHITSHRSQHATQ